ncbi:hypothetical protein Ahy_A05g021686 [Arachis hypogaea]|uniref:Amino acid transporter transmembrane domain-containing protein n=1 Tax=Arachis hypogaea TaxID=3818 RepID=A0A445CXZ7_ARAHY|nr:hypothetical protein Ahy_A05g021686 [Arachis hypogaea]
MKMLKTSFYEDSCVKTLVGFIALCVPFFGGLLGFFGGLAFTSTSYIIPGVLWLAAPKPKHYSKVHSYVSVVLLFTLNSFNAHSSWKSFIRIFQSYHFFLSQVCITIGLFIAITAPIGGVRTIILSIKTYKFFS